MQSTPPFSPSSDGTYRILTALDQSRCLTVQGVGKPLVLDSFKGGNNQKFAIYGNNGKYAFVNTETNAAIHVSNDANKDGAPLAVDSNQHQSSFFDITKITAGQFAGKAFYIKTFCGKGLDIFEGRTTPGTPIIQWAIHGNSNQVWFIVPSDGQIQNTNQGQGFNAPSTNQNTFPQVPPNFTPGNTSYKILSALNTGKALTLVGQPGQAKISDFTGDISQSFKIYPNGNKFALVCDSSNQGLCFNQDSAQNGAILISDPGQHNSSWFQIVRVAAGQWSGKAYKLKTHANKTLDVFEGNQTNGTKIVQYGEHAGYNQIWIIVPFTQQTPKYISQQAKSNTNQGPGGLLGGLGINLPFQLPQIPKFGW